MNDESPIYARFARSFINRLGNNAMYFKCQQGFFSPAAKHVKISVIYYDDIKGSTWQLKYDAGKNRFKTAFTVTCTGTKTWKTNAITVTDAVMQNNGPGGCDFALVNSDNLNDIFHMIEIEKKGIDK